MKKLGLFLIVLMPVIAAFGQTEKGNFVLSGATGLNFNSINEKFKSDGETSSEYKMNSFSVLPTFGYFIDNNLAIGLSGSFSTERVNHVYTYTSTVVMPTLIYYFPSKGKFRTTVKAGVGYSSEKQSYRSTTEPDNYKFSGMAANLGGGVSYFIAEKISVNLDVLYTGKNMNSSDDVGKKYRGGEFTSSIGFSVFL